MAGGLGGWVGLQGMGAAEWHGALIELLHFQEQLTQTALALEA